MERRQELGIAVAGNSGLRVVVGTAMALAGVALVLYATAGWGPVVTWDSLVYLGVVDSTASATTSALFAPLFRLVLRGMANAGVPALGAARVLNSLLFGVLIGLSVCAGARYGRSRWAFAMTGSLVLASYVLLEQFSRVMSEPLALCAGFGGLLAVAAYLQRPDRPLLLLAALGFGAALAARYASVPFLAVGCLGILLQARRPLAVRVRDAAILGTVACLPIAAWMIRNRVKTGGVLHRAVVFHPPAAATLVVAASEVSSWILPRRVPFPVRLIALGLFAIAWIALERAGRARARDSAQDGLGRILVLFCLLYSGFLLFVSAFVDASVTVGTRHLLPIYVAGLWLLGRSLDRALIATATPVVRRVALLGAGLFIAVSGAGAGMKAFLLHRDGDGYGGRLVQTSVIGGLSKEPFRGHPVYAADAELVRYVASVDAHRFPSKFDPMTLTRNLNYLSQLESVMAELRRSGGATVRLVGGPENPRYPTVSELEEPLGLGVIAEDGFARVYGSRP